MKNIKEYITNQRVISSSNKNKILGLTTGLNQLDVRVSGYKKKELNVIASRYDDKISLALTSVIANIDADKEVLYFSLQLSKEQLLTRIICMKSGISLPLLKRGILNEEADLDFDLTVNELKTQNLFIEDTKYCDINYIKNKSKEMVNNKDNDIEMIVIDSLELIDNDGEINIAREIKKLAIDLDIPIIVLAQLNSKIEKRINQRPLLSDLKKKNLETEADTILFIYVDDNSLENKELNKELKSELRGDQPPYKSTYIDKPKVLAEIIVAKQLNGMLGSCGKYDYNKETTKFSRKDSRTFDKVDEIQSPRLTKIFKELAEFRNGYKYSHGLPYDKEEYKTIQVLDAYNLKLKKIPKEIIELSQLEIIRIQENKIKKLPKTITRLKELKALCLCNNKLESIPSFISAFKNLEELAICKNPTLIKLPDSFSQLHLTSLSIDGNLVNKYIDLIINIKTLEELEIHGGLLSNEALIKLAILPNLKELAFETIKNKKFQKKIEKFEKLEFLTIKDSKNFKFYNNNIHSSIFKNIISIQINGRDILSSDFKSNIQITDIF